MKKLNVVVVALVMLIAGNSATAQTKFGYIRIDDIVGLMPELQKLNLDTVGQQFIKDSVLPRLEYVQGEYSRKMTDLNDTTKSAAVRGQILKDLQEYKQELDGAEQIIQQVQQYKQQELLKPYYAKAKKAIDAVAKKKGYTHVVSSDVFLVAPEADDLSLSVLAELKIELPKNPPAKAGN
jgi:outer membrane protein